MATEETGTEMLARMDADRDRVSLRFGDRLYGNGFVCTDYVRASVYALVHPRINGDLTGAPPRTVYLGPVSVRRSGGSLRVVAHGCGDGSRAALDGEHRRALRAWARSLWERADTPQP